MAFAGIDVGSLTTKAVILKKSGACGSFLMPTGTDIQGVARKVLDQVLSDMNLSFESLARIVSTGYGRVSIPFADDRVSEITCNAIGVHHLYPHAELVVDIGGQDSKVIKMNSVGKVVNFAMNDKCAAGTGKFLEVAAETLGVTVGDLAGLSSKSCSKVRISSVCTVFAQTEIVSLIAKQTPKEDIANGLQESVVNRVSSLINSIQQGPKDKMVITGGVAKNARIVELFEEMFGNKIIVPENPQIVTALGAAIFAESKGIRS